MFQPANILTDSLKSLSLRTLFDAAADAMLLVDDAGHIVLANSSAQQLFGHSEDEFCRLTVEMLIPARYRKQYLRHREFVWTSLRDDLWVAAKRWPRLTVTARK